MTITELKNNLNYKFHHSALRRGYVSRKSEGKIEEYSGRFGKGYILITPNWNSTQYVNISYYIKQD
mgnify:CR=1 FL=1